MTKKKFDTKTIQGEHKYYDYLYPQRHKPGTPPLLIVDGSYLAYQAFFAYKKLTYKGDSVAMLYGAPMILKAIITMLKPHRVIIVWDGKKHPRRLELNPNYKGHRSKDRDPEERKKFLNQMKETRKLFKYLGLSQIRNKDQEADDMIYTLVRKQVKLRPIIIVSGDKDYIQLVDYDISVYHPVKKIKDTAYTFGVNWGILIPQFVDYLCLIGDKSDDIEGIKGIGPVRAKAFLSKFNSIKEYLENDKAEFPGLMDKDKLRRIYKRNREMIDLAYFHKKNLKGVKPHYLGKQYNSFDELKYRSLCGKYNFKSLLATNFIETFTEL